MHTRATKPAAVLAALVLAACAPTADEPAGARVADGLSYEVRGSGEPILFILSILVKNKKRTAQLLDYPYHLLQCSAFSLGAA